MSETADVPDPEIVAISTVYAALRELDSDAQRRVLTYVTNKLKVALPDEESAGHTSEAAEHDVPAGRGADTEAVEDDLDGVSVVARRWMKRSGFKASDIQRIFSIGGDEIDLIAQTVPGPNKKERMRSVFLLKGISAYLASGALRFTHAQAKEACAHYDAWDSTNFAANLRDIAAEVGGNRQTGYTLTARGLANATETIRTMIGPKTG